MPEKVVPGPVCEDRSIREAVCIHTKKIFDSCKDKDCIEDIRVYPTRSSPAVIDRAQSVKAGTAELLYAYIDVEPINFNRGFYTVDVRYFYRITADAFVGAARPVEVTGLAIFDKRVVLFGSEGSSKIFSTGVVGEGPEIQNLPQTNLPSAVVEAVDPIILNLKLMDACNCHCCDNSYLDIPPAITAVFQEDLIVDGDIHRMFVTLGQFSIIRLERDTQLLIPVYDYCLPEKECTCGCGCECQEDPCEMFRKVQFPFNEFFPPNSIQSKGNTTYQEVRSGCCN